MSGIETLTKEQKLQLMDLVNEQGLTQEEAMAYVLDVDKDTIDGDGNYPTSCEYNDTNPAPDICTSVELLPPVCMDIVRPAVTAIQAVAAWNEFQQLKKAIITQSDLQRIQGKDFIKKSGWRKFAQYFNLTDDIISEVREPLGDTDWVRTIKVKCIAANGRSTVGVGKCASNEKKFAHLEHDTYATAHTRAKNRAISDLIAVGEVSAEEVME